MPYDTQHHEPKWGEVLTIFRHGEVDGLLETVRVDDKTPKMSHDRDAVIFCVAGYGKLHADIVGYSGIGEVKMTVGMDVRIEAGRKYWLEAAEEIPGLRAFEYLIYWIEPRS